MLLLFQRQVLRGHLAIISKAFGHHFEFICGSFCLGPPVVILGSSGDYFGITWKSFWDYLEIIWDSFSNHVCSGHCEIIWESIWGLPEIFLGLSGGDFGII